MYYFGKKVVFFFVCLFFLLLSPDLVAYLHFRHVVLGILATSQGESPVHPTIAPAFGGSHSQSRKWRWTVKRKEKNIIEMNKSTAENVWEDP